MSHLNKSAGSQAVYRIMGSLGFVAAARAAWAVAKDKDNPTRRLVLPMKNNLARDVALGMAYSIVDSPVMPGVGVLAWEPDPVSLSVDEALAPDHEGDEGVSALDDATGWLRQALADGRLESKDVQKLAKENGHAWATVRRAKDEVGVIVEREGFGPGAKWFWSLPSIDAQEPP